MDNDPLINNPGFIILAGLKEPIIAMRVTRNQAGRVVQLSILLDERLRGRVASEHSFHLQLRDMDSAIHVDVYECPSDDWDQGRRLATPGLIHFHTARELTLAESQAIEQWLKALQFPQRKNRHVV